MLQSKYVHIQQEADENGIHKLLEFGRHIDGKEFVHFQAENILVLLNTDEEASSVEALIESEGNKKEKNEEDSKIVN